MPKSYSEQEREYIRKRLKCPFHVLNKPFKAFLRLLINVSKVNIQLAAYKKIRVCNLTILLQIVQMSLSAFGELVAKRYPRDSFTITTKMPVFMAKSAEET